ncbi:MAG: NAD-glutamate dehydrogenase, partial [Pseudomonadota bacterium]|nr:NAD-glutamate dehydrogenase [Pseudomonadota bacterium]
MGFEGLLGTEEERSARRLIEHAGALLSGGIPPGFVARLFNHAAPEDLVGYAPEELASLAVAAWDFLAVRKPGLPKIRFVTPPVPSGGERLKDISIIEIANDDMPFLVDSVMGELTERGFAIRLVVHPVFAVRREIAGRLQQLMAEGSGAGAGLRESFIHIHVERIEDEIVRSETIAALEAVLADVRVSVADWRAMLARVGELIAALRTNPPPLPVEEIAEAVQFLEWLATANFTFLGSREYAFAMDGELQPKFDTGLGVLRGHDVRELSPGADQAVLKREIAAFFSEPKALMITKSNLRSRVHRRALMDYVSVKRFDRDGNAVGETRIVGLLTSTAYTRSTKTIPYLRRKVDSVLTRAGFDPDGHSGKALVNLLETYPRDELFQTDDDTLYQFALAILQLDERPRVRVLARRDRFDRFVSVLVYVPRERAGTGVVDAIGALLAESYKGHVSAFNLFFPEGPLVRIHFIIARAQREIAEPDRASLEDAVSAVIRTWADALSEALALAYEGAKAKQLYARYHRAFSASYREHYPPATAIEDIRTIEGLSAARPLGVHFHGRPGGERSCAGLKVWSHGRPIPLSDRVPVLENMGFRVVDERTYDIAPTEPGAPPIWLHDMMLERADGVVIDLAELKSALEATFLVVMGGIAENDGYNALVLKAGLRWRDVALLRTISRYLRQIRVPFSQSYMWETLGRHAGIAARIVELFHARFDPREYSPSFQGAGEAREPGIQTQTLSADLDSGSGASRRPGMTGEDERTKRAAREAAILADIEAALNDVPSLDEDRILRHFVNAMRAAIRTNFYQIDAGGQPKPLIAVKFDSRKIDALPLPHPLYEIFVYSPRVEGVHLRFGKVARGGVRWSDRPQDFRTEILGLAKAQQVKNAVIVPVGAKGGFVPKLLPAAGAREVIAAEGVAAYKLFISSLLDLTDNISPDGGIVAPDNVVRHDDDDPYLVVAADKGTASFSDVANEISLVHHFWLGDAFASGGSAGYDHKQMAITARGAWEAVRRHFREMDVNITRTPFTVAGVGDMSGDVFGNGMLREKTIRLQAAFDHRDIFIDPDPDAEKSFAERARLFARPRSSWQDYDKNLISPGGGAFSRAAKEVPLSPQMQALTGISADKATPAEVIKA